MRDLCWLIASLLAAAFFTGRGAPPPLARAAALEDSLSAPQRGPRVGGPAVTRGPQAPPVFRVSARLVQVSVVVHDSRGQPVSDLKKEDFTITEKGKAQQISFFSMASADRPAAPPAALPPHIFTNAFEHRGGVPTSVTVVLLDLLNTSWTDQLYARKALIKFLGQIQPQDRIAIFALGKRSLTLLHDYTTDSASLLARVKKATGEIPSDLDASTLDSSTQEELQNLGLDGLADANQVEADFFTAGRIVNTLSTLQAIAQHLSGLPGRKNLIWVSGGFPLTIGFDQMPAIGSTRDQRTFSQETDATVRALNNSGVAVYPVDARGLMVLPGFDASARRAPPTGPRLAASNANIDSMRELAERTGGRAAYNTNDLASAIRRAIDDTRVTYTIGYYSTDETPDGKFREIKVKVNRPRLDVRHRKGYFALKPSDNTPKARKDEVRAAVWSPIESTAVAINARADSIEQPEPNTVNVFVQINAAGIGFRKEGDRWKAELDIVYVQKDEHGRLPGNGITDTLSLALTDANYATIMKDGFIRQRRFPRQPGATNLRIVVRDVASGSIGSLTIPFSQVPAQPEKLAPK
jgi:VWFA-related protein